MGLRTHIWHWIGVSSLVLALVLVLDRQMPESGDVYTSSSVSSRDFTEGTSFYTLYHEGTPVGQIRTTRARRLPSGFAYDVRTELRLTAMGQSVEILVELSANFDATFGLESIDFSMESGPTSAKGRAEVKGKVLNIELKTGGTTITHAMPFDRHLVLSALLGPSITADALQPGDTRTLNVFDPLSQTVRKTQITAVAYEDIRVLDRPIKTLKIRQETMGVVLNGWVNSRGEMVRQELGLGLVAQLEPKAVAEHHSAQKKGRVDLISEVMIPVKSMPTSMNMQSSIQYRISGLSSAAVLENSERQMWASNVMTITRESLNTETPFSVSAAKVEDDDLLYQAGNAQVRALALEVAADAGTVDQLVANALNWFEANIEQEAVASIPSALETLRTRTGDCNEHAFLFAGMMRSLGVKTRVVAGIAYIERLEKFGYHAWNEIQMGDRFVTVDPTWRQFPADLTHIALARGGLQAQSHLWSLMGRLKVDVVAPTQ